MAVGRIGSGLGNDLGFKPNGLVFGSSPSTQSSITETRTKTDTNGKQTQDQTSKFTESLLSGLKDNGPEVKLSKVMQNLTEKGYKAGDRNIKAVSSAKPEDTKATAKMDELASAKKSGKKTAVVSLIPTETQGGINFADAAKQSDQLATQLGADKSSIHHVSDKKDLDKAVQDAKNDGATNFVILGNAHGNSQKSTGSDGTTDTHYNLALNNNEQVTGKEILTVGHQLKNADGTDATTILDTCNAGGGADYLKEQQKKNALPGQQLSVNA